MIGEIEVILAEILHSFATSFAFVAGERLAKRLIRTKPAGGRVGGRAQRKQAGNKKRRRTR